MQVRITLRYLVAFIALNMVMGELHEQVHINTGYLIYGCYGTRNFNVWTLCDHGTLQEWAFLATLAGPLFSCSLMWLGAWWIRKSSSDHKKAAGFALLFSNLPFARIFTALTGGGDEKVVIQSILGADPLISKLIAALLVAIICLPPMIIAYRKLEVSHRFLMIAGFAITPLIYGMFYHHMFLNWLLERGILSGAYILGTPTLVLLHFLVMLFLLVLFGKSLLHVHPRRIVARYGRACSIGGSETLQSQKSAFTNASE